MPDYRILFVGLKDNKPTDNDLSLIKNALLSAQIEEKKFCIAYSSASQGWVNEFRKFFVVLGYEVSIILIPEIITQNSINLFKGAIKDRMMIVPEFISTCLVRELLATLRDLRNESPEVPNSLNLGNGFSMFNRNRSNSQHVSPSERTKLLGFSPFLLNEDRQAESYPQSLDDDFQEEPYSQSSHDDFQIQRREISTPVYNLNFFGDEGTNSHTIPMDSLQEDDEVKRVFT